MAGCPAHGSSSSGGRLPGNGVGGHEPAFSRIRILPARRFPQQGRRALSQRLLGLLRPGHAHRTFQLLPVEAQRLGVLRAEAGALGGCRTWESPAANRPQRRLFHRLLAPWRGYGAANPAENPLAGTDFRFRRPKCDSLLASGSTGRAGSSGHAPTSARSSPPHPPRWSGRAGLIQ